MELTPIVYAVGPNRTLTPARSQHVDFSGGATTLSPAEAQTYHVVPGLVADAERRAMRFSQSTKEAQKAARPRGSNPQDEGDSDPDPLRSLVRWLVEARERVKRWVPGGAMDEADSPAGLMQEYAKRQREAVAAGADGRIVARFGFNPPRSLLEHDAERRNFDLILRGQRVG